MKTFRITVIISLLLILEVNAFSQPWLWGRGATGYGSQMGNSTTIDNSGNVYIAGGFDTTITFESTTLTNPGGGGAFIAKYDASGNFLWGRNGTGSNYSYATSVASDSWGNVYVVGAFGNPSITFGSFTLLNSGPTDLFIVKYDSLGNVLWAKGVGGAFGDEAKSVTTDMTGNIYITGLFSSSSITFGSTTLSTPGMFITKCDSAGNFLWAKCAGADYSGEAFSVSTNSTGVYITGYFNSDNATFGSMTLANAGSAGSGTEDIFIVKYDTLGTFGWAIRAGGSGDDRAYSISTDASSIYITGLFSSSTATFGSVGLSTAGLDDVFLVKYDLSGGVLWAKRAGGPSQDRAYSVNVDPSGTYIVGGFNSPMISFDFFNLTPPSAGYTPLFVVKYDSGGNVICADVLESGGERCAVASSIFGSAYITGNHNKDPLIVGADTLANIGFENVFLAKYYCNSGNGINEMDKKESFSIYPNPFTSQATIVFFKEQKNVTIKILNILGKEIRVFKHSGIQLIVESEDIKKGIYFVKVENDNGISVKKVIVE